MEAGGPAGSVADSALRPGAHNKRGTGKGDPRRNKQAALTG